METQGEREENRIGRNKQCINQPDQAGSNCNGLKKYKAKETPGQSKTCSRRTHCRLVSECVLASPCSCVIDRPHDRSVSHVSACRPISIAAHQRTLAPIRSRCLFCASTSSPVALANMLRRLAAPANWSILSSISFSIWSSSLSASNWYFALS